jgi:signal transduction histidine kinase
VSTASMADPADRAAEFAALELLPDPVVVIDEGGVIRYANDLAVRLTGGARLQDRFAPEALPMRDDSDRDWWVCARPLERDPRTAARIPETYLQLRGSDGRNRAITLTASLPSDMPDGVRLVLSLRRAERRRRVDDARSDLVSTVSHEIRSPLTSVKGFTKTLLAKWDRFTDAQKRQMLATIEEDADRVTRLLGELLDVSRIDAGRLQLHRQMLDVPAIADRVIERMRVHSDGTRLSAGFPGEVPRLYADPDKVEQIFTNLVENAVKYGDGNVHLSAEVDDSEVCFTVTDEGPGIPASQLTTIFGKFFRRAGERRSGTGLGLYISRGLVEAHGGRIWAESEPDNGASFHFTLPRGGLELAGIELPPTVPDHSEAR